MIRLTKRDFRQWLVANQDKLVGSPGSTFDCPFCRFLKSKGASQVSIPLITYRIVDGETHVHNKWQRRFQTTAIRQSIELGLDVAGFRGRHALKALNKVTP